MLRQLHIRDYAIIEELQLEFAPGFNVLTGETGAGKSILMQALDLACGGRASPEAIRTGAEEAVIESVFDLSSDDARALAETGLPAGDELHIRRIVSRAGKSRVYVDGTASSVALLDQLGRRLIHVYGQHEQSLLLRPESHLELLDTYAAHADLLAAMAGAFAALAESRERLAHLRAGLDGARQRADLIRFQLQELQAAAPRPGEDEELRRERDVLAHAEKLRRICQESEEILYSGDLGLTSTLGRVQATLREAGRIDPAFGDTIELLDAAQAQIGEAADRLRDYSERISFDPERREAVEERWALLQRLVRKYGGSLAALLRTQEELAAELLELERRDADPERLETEVAAAEAAAWGSAGSLSGSRRRKANLLERAVTTELHSLGMQDGVFSVVFAPPEQSPDSEECAARSRQPPGGALSRTGADVVEFHFSANQGEPPRPMARIASGGELSRIMLALKVVTAGRGEVASLVFDEVDAGIGGIVADAVGARLRRLGRSRQILCITHLPQIAARAEHHYVVEKRVREGRTISIARQLEREERIAELSRMLGGADDAEAARYARRLVSTRRDA